VFHSNQSNDSSEQPDLLNQVDETVKYVRKLLKKYDWELSERQGIETDLEIISQKRNEKCLYLSVIGEFSSGKSTFINALLRQNLLESDNIQGTTIAKTVIRYGKKYDVVVKFRNGKTKRYSKSKRFYWIAWLLLKLIAPFRSKTNTGIKKSAFGLSFNELRQHIVELTTNTDFAGQVQEVIVEHPAVVLKSGIAIIDTPGTNSIESWHEDVTGEAIRELSDVSVILTAADKPLPNTLNEFIKENLSDVLNHCIFVATKIDNVREKEREYLLSYIKQKAFNEFNLPEPVVLPYTPMLVLGESDPSYKCTFSYDKADRQALIEESHKTEQTIYQRLSVQRINILAKKLSAVLNHSLSHLLKLMSVRADGYKGRYAILEKHQKPDFVEFINDMKNQCLRQLADKFEEQRKQTIDKIHVRAKSQTQKFKGQLFAVPNKEQLEPFCSETYLRSWLTDNATELVNISHNDFSKFSDIANTVMDEFGTEFTTIYSELAVLDIKSASINYGVDYRNLGISSFESEYLKQTLDSINKSKHADDNSFGRVGAMAGNAYGGLPGALLGGAIGTLLGGVGKVIGGIVKFLFGPSLIERKQQIWKELDPIFRQSYSNIDNYIINDLNDKYEKLREHIITQIDKYYSAYRKFITAMILRNKEEKELLEKYISMTEADKFEIESKLQIITQLR